jgi:hypothetical protein
MTEGNIRWLIDMPEFHKIDWDMEEDVKELFSLAKSCYNQPMQIPTMDLVSGEVIFRDVPEQAMESFLSQRTGDINMDALIALKHGITLGPGIKSINIESHPVNSIQDAMRWDAKHNKFRSIGEVKAIMELLPDAGFTFVGDARRKNSKLIDAFIDAKNETTFISKLEELAGLDFYDSKKNILIFDMNSMSPLAASGVCSDFLGVLHINSDDDAPWPPVN